MPLFSRFKSRGSQSATKKVNENSNGAIGAPKPKWQSNWSSKSVVPEEIEELIHACTAEMKSRAEALDSPFLLLPYRPGADASSARTFIRNYFKSNGEGSAQYRGASLQQELRLTEPIVLCSIVKWCWSRMPGGVVTWPVYEAFRIGEKESNLARNAFETFVPIGAESTTRRNIILDFFDLLSAVAAHGKLNGLGGRKLSRLAGWWAFEHSDDGKGFEGGYRSWAAAADASSHLFFAYLRTLSPEANPAMSLIERIPRSLQALLASTEYPPETPSLMQTSTPRVVMIVDHVSPTPFALLRRARHFEYRDQDKVLREYQEFEDPLDALTDECKRVLYAISATNSKAALSRHGNAAHTNETWSSFQNLGFSDLEDKLVSPGTPAPSINGSMASPQRSALRSEPRSRNADFGRPTTPSWADFMSSGFDDQVRTPTTLMLPSDKLLPPIGSRAQTPLLVGEDDLAPGELAAITTLDLDDAFWWVWMTSLAGEEPAERKAVFGRCALVETTIMNGRWLIMEEQVKGASPDPAEGAYIAPKKSFFSFTKRGRLGRKRSTSKKITEAAANDLTRTMSASTNKSYLAPDQHSKIKAAAAALAAGQQPERVDDFAQRRGRTEDATATKPSSTLTMGVVSEATPAMKWASAYDKNAIRAQYLGDAFAGKGISREELVKRASATNLNGNTADSSSKDRTLPSPPGANQISAQSASAALSSTSEPTSGLGATSASNGNDVDALDRDTEASSPGSPRRKPVPSREAHSAMRKQDIDDDEGAAPSPVIAPAPHQSPPSAAAAAAAAKAMQTGTTGPDPKAVQRKQPPSNASGFKKFFGKKREDNNRNSMDVVHTAPNNLATSADNNAGRRLSLIRKKPVGATNPQANQAAIAAQLASAQSPPRETNMEPVFNDAALERGGSSDREETRAEREWSRFDQGSPHEFAPHVAPFDDDDDDDVAVAAPIPQRPTNTETAARIAPELPSELLNHGHAPSVHDREEATLTHDKDDTDAQSEATIDNEPMEKDRWATIRENAARRAARMSEEQSNQSHHSHGARTDDGETSGEETIESRVARIKARVAELTGGIDQGANTARR